MTIMAIAAAIGAGAGFLQGKEDKRVAAKQRKRESEIAKWTPWSGYQAQRVAEPQSIPSRMLQGGLTGAGFGQSINAFNYQNDLAQQNLAQNANSGYGVQGEVPRELPPNKRVAYNPYEDQLLAQNQYQNPYA